MFKIVKNLTKIFFIFRGTHVDATWHLGPRGSATRAHAAPMRCYIYIYYYYIIYKGSSDFPIEEGLLIPINRWVL